MQIGAKDATECAGRSICVKILKVDFAEEQKKNHDVYLPCTLPGMMKKYFFFEKKS
jgi:hypothetical protein